MVRALTERWAQLGRHPQGRILQIALETLWYLALFLATWSLWDTPRTWFGYLSL